MSEIMRSMPFGQLMDWALSEYARQKSVFGVREDKFYRNRSGGKLSIFGEEISSPIGPAAGPNAQLAQNIIAAYFAGSRFMELKTVQKMDGEELRNCVPRPCINAEDECYNVEWSTELTVPQAFDEYVKAWFAIQVLAKEFGVSDRRDFAYNMSVGYDLDGIKGEKIDNYIEGMKDASDTDTWKACSGWIRANAARLQRFTLSDLEGFSTRICASITLSTLHGCPPEEIERIAKYLLDEKKVHTYIKCNPTLLGYEFARGILDEMGYGYVSFDDHHFNNDLQYKDAVEMLGRLQAYARERNLAFGVKITNTFPVQIKRGELPGSEMYMSGRSLYPLSLNVANKLTKDFGGTLPISFSGGADAMNIEDLMRTGIRPITVATTILKPGGYERMQQLAQLVEPMLKDGRTTVDVDALEALAADAPKNPHHLKEKREVGSRKTNVPLGLFDCYQAPCKEGGCPIEQQIPEYLNLVADGENDRAFEVIAIDNAAPSITGTICPHPCQHKCTRLDYDHPLEIRRAKRIAAEAAQEAYTRRLNPPKLRTDKRAVVVGAGPAGIAAALFLRRNGVSVTVLEKRDEPFGIVRYVIPEFRIEAAALKRDFEMALKMGVEFVFGADERIDIGALKQKYDYVLLAVGAWKEGARPVREGYENMRDALEFLEESKASDCALDLGSRVAVIGGGDVAMDCARAAKRAPGVEDVYIVYRRTMEFMPAEPEEIRLAKEDGIHFKELLGPVQCDVKTLICEKMVLGDWDDSGRRGINATGELEVLHFDTVISAVGARVDTSAFEENGVALDSRGRVKMGEGLETSIEDVYAIGDCKAGPATIVAAIADAKKAVRQILKKIGLGDDFERVSIPQDIGGLYAKKGVLCEACDGATDGYRCLSCDQLCELCCDVCPNRANVAIRIDGGANLHQILHIDGMCNECGNCGVFCPHAGNPYKDKLTLFWTEEDFKDSENRGFLPLGGEMYRLRLEGGEVVDAQLSDARVPALVRASIEAVNERYPYFLAK